MRHFNRGTRDSQRFAQGVARYVKSGAWRQTAMPMREKVYPVLFRSNRDHVREHLKLVRHVDDSQELAAFAGSFVWGSTE